MISDKDGKEMRVGDVLKVFHFEGARRKKHYMYKQIVGKVKLGMPPTDYFKVSHLSRDPKEHYLINFSEGHLKDYEIVQSWGCNDKG